MTDVSSRVAWGAIVAGSLTAIGLFLLVGSLVTAVGASVTGYPSERFVVLLFVLFVLPLCLGGWVTGRLAAGESRAEALLFGFILWSLTALVLLYLALNGMLLLGAGIIFGIPGQTETLEVTTSEAWWSFVGVALSLAATLLGTLAGHPSGWRLRRRTRRIEPQPA